MSGCKIFAEEWKEAAGFCMQIMKAGDLPLCVLAASVGTQSDIYVIY